MRLEIAGQGVWGGDWESSQKGMGSMDGSEACNWRSERESDYTGCGRGLAGKRTGDRCSEGRATKVASTILVQFLEQIRVALRDLLFASADSHSQFFFPAFRTPSYDLRKVI